jgi:hypothetical protein
MRPPRESKGVAGNQTGGLVALTLSSLGRLRLLSQPHIPEWITWPRAPVEEYSPRQPRERTEDRQVTKPAAAVAARPSPIHHSPPDASAVFKPPMKPPHPRQPPPINDMPHPTSKVVSSS